MLLAVDIGNSSVSLGVFSTEDGKLLHTFKLTADKDRSSDEYLVQICSMLDFASVDKRELDAAVLSSVVPTLTCKVGDAVKKIVDADVMTVGPGLKTGFSIRIDDPSELGSDLVANTAAALELNADKKLPVIIIDMGTATTVSAITAKGEYVGNSIIPGIRLSLEALRSKTELLPTITPVAPKNVIGRNSVSSVRSGIILGNAFMLDAFIDAYAAELDPQNIGVSVFLTGGLAGVVLSSLRHEVRYEPELTLKGLYRIFKNNRRPPRA